MRAALRSRYIVLSLAAVVLMGASAANLALFEAERPGAVLAPVDGADRLVEILQGSQSIVWTSLHGAVSSIRVTGWATATDGNELGGALVIDRIDGASSGLIDFGERPQSIEFDLRG